MTLRGEYDTSNADALWNELVCEIAADEADLVLDLGAVTFLDASTITVFISARTALLDRKRSFSLCSLSAAADRIIRICGLECLVESVPPTLYSVAANQRDRDVARFSGEQHSPVVRVQPSSTGHPKDRTQGDHR